MLLHQLFEESARRFPDNAALVFKDQSVTYAALNARSNQLARQLRKRGVGPESVVGICLNRCPDLVVAFLAVLKAGGACLALDPESPAERLAYMLQDTCAGFVLSRSTFSSTIEAIDRFAADETSATGAHRAQPICLDAAAFEVDGEPTGDPCYPILPANLCLVFYTSGSTGSPKAVLVEHGRREIHASWQNRTFRLTDSDRHLLKATIGFTLLAAEIFLPLLSGGQLIIVPSGREQDAAYLARLIVRHQITSITLVPAMLRSLLELDEFALCTSLREVCSFGEVLSAALMRRLHQHAGVTLTLAYGATEAPSAAFLQCDRDVSASSLQLGAALPGKEVYLLNERLERVGVGEQGEICIAGELARGYMGRPDLTAEKFVPHPFAAEPGTRLYRTGDFGRYLTDTDIEFIGRADEQLNIRGYRVEPGEVERILSQHSAVLQAAVVGREGGANGLVLVAFYVPRSGRSIAKQALRTYLKDKLPPFMVPTVLAQLSAMPLTPNGKLDRRALPDLESIRTSVDRSEAKPSTRIEKDLFEIWSRILGRDQIGVHDDFFELGGDSLLGVRLIQAVAAELRRPIEVSLLFEAPTISRMATRLADRVAGEAHSSSADRPGARADGSTLDTLRHAAGPTTLVMFPPLGHTSLFFHAMLEHVNAEWLVLCARIQQAADFETIEQFSERMVVELLDRPAQGPFCLAGVCRGTHYAYEVGRRLVLAGREVVLFVVDGESPRLHTDEPRVPTVKWRQVIHNFLRNVSYYGPVYVRRYLSFHWEELRDPVIRTQRQLQRLQYQMTERYIASAEAMRIVIVESEAVRRHPDLDAHHGWQKLAGLGYQNIIFEGADHDNLAVAGSPYTAAMVASMHDAIGGS